MGRHGDIKARMAGLAGLDVLRHCDRHELRALAGVFTERSVGDDAVLCRAGDEADEVFLIRRGYVGVVVGGDLIATLGPGAMAGEIGPLGDHRRSADLMAMTNCDLYVAPAADMRALLSDSVGLRRAVTPLLAERAEENHQRSAS